MTIVNEPTSGGEGTRLVCPRCNSEKIWKDGSVPIKNGYVQRYVCNKCEYRFRGEKILSSDEQDHSCRVCDIITESKNLTVVSLGLTTGDNDSSRIIELYEHHLMKEGLRPSTIDGYVRIIQSLLNNSVDLLNPDSVKE